MGGGKSKSKAPPTPDYAGLAVQQGAQDRQTAAEITAQNRPTQTDMFGNTLNWARDPTTGAWSQSVTMDPTLQAQWQNLIGQQGQAQNMFGGLLGVNMRNMSSMPFFNAPGMPADTMQGLTPNSAPLNMNEWGVRGVDPSTTGQLDMAKYGLGTVDPITGVQSLNDWGIRGIDQGVARNAPQFDPNSGQAVSDALFESVMGRARPEQERERSMLTTQLRQQGLQPGTEAFDRAMQNTLRAQGDVTTLAGQNATLAGYNEARQQYASSLAGQNQMFNQLMGSESNNRANLAAFLANQGQAFGERATSQGLNQALAGLGLGQQNQAFNQRVTADASNRQNMSLFQQMQQQQFGQQQAAADAQRQNYLARLQGQGQEFGQSLTERNQPLEELSFWQQLAGTPQSPAFQGFSGATGYNPADMIGAANAQFGANMGKYNANQSKKGGLLGAGASLGGSLLGGKF